MTPFSRFFRNANRWLIQTPERALDQAYDAALMIRAIEDQHFNGEKISRYSGAHTDNVGAYFEAELKKYLKIAEVRLTEFKASRTIVDSTNSTLYNRSLTLAPGDRERSSAFLEKLQFIDATLARYKPEVQSSQALVPISQVENAPLTYQPDSRAPNTQRPQQVYADNGNSDDNSVLDKTGVLPRSILGTLNRIKRDLDPNSEQEVVKSFRTSKAKTLISMRLILLMIIVPLLTQQFSRTFIIGPIIDRVWQPQKQGIFLNYELEEEALKEFNMFKERLEFDKMLGRAPDIVKESEEGMDKLLQEKAQEIAVSYSRDSSGAVKNVFADLFTLIAFAIVLVTNQRDVEILKTFIDETVYGLSDSAKAFIIILFTDMFVGFHSPHGWEVLLEGAARHLGLPASRDFIFLFIATFPVILDTIFKYWIFRYLNRISPSAVATYKNMNE
jgi:hypothetical protein